MPWLFLSVAVILWGLAPVKAFLNGGPRGLAAYRAGAAPGASAASLSPTWNVPLLHRAGVPRLPGRAGARRSRRGFTIRPTATRRAEARGFTLNWAVGDRHRDSARGARDRAVSSRLARDSCCRSRSTTFAHARAARDDHADAGARLRDALRRHRRDARPRVHEDRRALSVLRGVARLARRRADGIRHQLERPLRQPAEDHRAAARLQSGADRHGQQHRRRHGQDDRRPEHRRRDRRRPDRSGRKARSCGSCSGTASRSRRSWARSSCCRRTCFRG